MSALIAWCTQIHQICAPQLMSAGAPLTAQIGWLGACPTFTFRDELSVGVAAGRNYDGRQMEVAVQGFPAARRPWWMARMWELAAYTAALAGYRRPQLVSRS